MLRYNIHLFNNDDQQIDWMLATLFSGMPGFEFVIALPSSYCHYYYLFVPPLSRTYEIVIESLEILGNDTKSFDQWWLAMV